MDGCHEIPPFLLHADALQQAAGWPELPSPRELCGRKRRRPPSERPETPVGSHLEELKRRQSSIDELKRQLWGGYAAAVPAEETPSAEAAAWIWRPEPSGAAAGAEVSSVGPGNGVKAGGFGVAKAPNRCPPSPPPQAAAAPPWHWEFPLSAAASRAPARLPGSCRPPGLPWALGRHEE
ncbi:protein INCA1 [Apteryx mantelli]|uniref:Protein INCA1 n=1 Tax=Apteryx mantelli TaxID=2696672 RepID=A0ABM4G1R0_9AVES